MILERSDEPLCKDRAQGCRPGKSCHTALRSRQKGWTGPQWFVDSDITGDFKNIDHDMLRELLKKRLEDTQFFDLIRDMLTAGSVEDWQFHKTYCGTPQGGIASPMLANISLHALDACMAQK